MRANSDGAYTLRILKLGFLGIPVQQYGKEKEFGGGMEAVGLGRTSALLPLTSAVSN